MKAMFARKRGGASVVITALSLTLGLCAAGAYAQDVDALKQDAIEKGQEALDKAAGSEKKSPEKAEKVENVQIPKGATILVILDTEISSKTAKVGDEIEAHLSSSDEADIFPKKTVFKGKIVQLSAKTASGPAVAKATFTEAILPNGTTVEIEAFPRPVKSADESKETSEKKKRKGGGIGGKAAGGALIGTAIAGNDAVGAIVGGSVAAAAAGGKRNKEAAAEAAKTVDIEIKEATKFELVFAKSFVLKRAVPK